MSNWAALFDWDGVIIDSGKHHAESWERLALEEKKTLPEGHFSKGFGRKNEWIIPNLLGWIQDEVEVRRLSLRKESLYREVVGEWGIEPLPGVREFLRELKKAGIPRVIGSSTHRLNIETSLDRMSLRDGFDDIVSAEDVSVGKPDPEVFLKAAKKAGVEPSWCVVFEDAHVGIAAARAGGMKVIALSTTHPAGSLGDADLVVPNLSHVTVEKVRQAFGW